MELGHLWITSCTQVEMMNDESLVLAREVQPATVRDPSLKSIVATTSIVVAILGASVILAGFPIFLSSVLAVCAGGSIALSGTSLRRDRAERLTAPEAIASRELRTEYRSLLRSLEEVVRVSAEAHRLRSTIEPFVARCRRSAAQAGRTAVLANPLQRYLERYSGFAIRRELDEIRRRTDDVTDPTTLVMLGLTAVVRTRQLAVYDRVVAKHGQVRARLALTRAFLDDTAAAIVKLHLLHDEEATVPAASTEELHGTPDLARLTSASRPPGRALTRRS